MKMQTAVPAILMSAMLSITAGCATTHMPEHKAATVIFNSCGKPVYPVEAVKESRIGTVNLGFQVSADGKLLDSKVNKSSGHRDLDQAALEGIKLCQFEAATLDGKPVAEWINIQYVWTLK
jgi:TonB family protein